MGGSWQSAATAVVAGSQLAHGGWPYLPGRQGAVEATALCALALRKADAPNSERRLARAASWLARLQREQGSLGVSAEFPAPGWPTSHAVLTWASLDTQPQATARAARWLEGRESLRVPVRPDGAYGHDTSLAGWSWTAKTHGWVEPTAMAIVALRAAGRHRSHRVAEGLRLLRDRRVPSGGWNYGNSTVFGAALRALPAPTGLALLALRDGDESGSIKRACAYLEGALLTTLASRSLCWGALGLAAWQRPPLPGEQLARAASATGGATAPHLRAAYALLADAPAATLKLLAPREARDG